MVKLVSKIISKIKHREYIIDEISLITIYFQLYSQDFYAHSRFFATIGFKKEVKFHLSEKSMY